MKKTKKTSIITLILLLTLITAGNIFSETELTEEYQQSLFDRLNHMRGGGPRPESLENLERSICGTSVAFEAFINQNRLSGAYKASAVMQGRNEDLEYSYESPDGHFLIHYDITGIHAVYKPDLDTLNGGDGIPDYINKVAEIADSSWSYVVDELGFPPPPRDDFYPAGLDSTYDIYIESLGGAYYGATFSEMLVDSQTATSVLVLDNDYTNFPPYDEYTGDPRDLNRRLDAVRVTMAHEFFHSIHFGMDWTEWEGADAMNARIYWWEMSAVWMEEMMYDDVNDYYGYLFSFFEYPWIGLRNFSPSAYPLAFHPYGSVVFPIYLTERWGDPTIIRKIWEQCRDLGIGPQFGEAVDNAVFEVSGGTHRLADAIGEFSVWNMFTGSRSNRVPAGFGYSEKEFYPIIPDTAMFEFDTLPVAVNNEVLKDLYRLKLPEMYGANIIKIDNIYLVPDSLSFNFYRGNDFRMMDWNISLIGIPLNDNADAVIQMNRYVGNPFDEYIVTGTENLYNLYAVTTPVYVDIDLFNSAQTFDYAFFVLDSLDERDITVDYKFKAYPNPCVSAQGCESFKFEIEKSFVDVAKDPASLSITIMNVAGEQVRTLYYDFLDPANSEDPTQPHDFKTVFTADWDLKNESGNDVASGVYLAYWKLAYTSFSNSAPLIQKSKFVVIK